MRISDRLLATVFVVILGATAIAVVLAHRARLAHGGLAPPPARSPPTGTDPQARMAGLRGAGKRGQTGG